jgi:methylated-DNA-[protein]-cysteine S-methyltransferase
MPRSICGQQAAHSFQTRGTLMREVMQFFIDQLGTAIGELVIVSDRDGNLRALDWADHEERMDRLLRLHYGQRGYCLQPASNPHGLTGALGRYFAGELGAIDNLPVKTAGTAFQREVWRALRTIACGSTVSYGQLAEQIGRPKAVRAVGLANGSNPVGIVVPCHRVVGSDGSLTGYGGGIARKEWLLQHERRQALVNGHGPAMGASFFHQEHERNHGEARSAQ